MENYVKSAPPSGEELEDIRRWADLEFAKIEKSIQSLITAIEELQNGA